jgi:hypothetical protein
MVNLARIRRKAINERSVSESMINAETVLRGAPSPVAPVALTKAP